MAIYIDATHLPNFEITLSNGKNYLLLPFGHLSDIPTADVVEVVRCKECKHWGGTTFGFVCRKFSGIETKICMGADHFCSYGEKDLAERSK